MCTRSECVTNVGNWVSFQTPWGRHRGVITEVNGRGVLMRVPRQYAPMGLASHEQTEGDDEKKLDATLAAYGYGYRGPYGGYGGYGPGYGAGYGRWGYPGYGAWYGGWWWWWLAFAWIFWLAFLW